MPSDSLCHEELVIWGYLINLEKSTLPERILMLEKYVPLLDNWAVCDSYCAHAKWMARADKPELWAFLQPYFSSAHEFEVRFAIVVAMTYFMTEEWLPKIFAVIESIDLSRIHSAYRYEKGKSKLPQQGTAQGPSPYYVRMAIAWLLATALAKYPELTRLFVRTTSLPEDVLKLYIRKARESFRTREVAVM
jgi:3-methyladenine DNA glycosylase AlkD